MTLDWLLVVIVLGLGTQESPSITTLDFETAELCRTAEIVLGSEVLHQPVGLPPGRLWTRCVQRKMPPITRQTFGSCRGALGSIDCGGR